MHKAKLKCLVPASEEFSVHMVCVW
jgi:hypothetical protein